MSRKKRSASPRRDRMGHPPGFSRRGDPNWKPKPAQPLLKQNAKLEDGRKTARVARKAPFLRPIPTDERIQNELADQLIEWALKNPFSVALHAFPLSRRFYPYKFYQIGKSNEYFATALSFAQHILITHMSESIWNNKGNYDYFKLRQRCWDTEYAEQEVAYVTKLIELRSQNYKNAQEEAGKINLIMHVAEDSPFVPKKLPSIRAEESDEDRNNDQTR